MQIARFNKVVETAGFVCAALIAADEISHRWWAAVGVILAAWAIWIVVDERNGLRNDAMPEEDH